MKEENTRRLQGGVSPFVIKIPYKVGAKYNMEKAWYHYYWIIKSCYRLFVGIYHKGPGSKFYSWHGTPTCIKKLKSSDYFDITLGWPLPLQDKNNNLTGQKELKKVNRTCETMAGGTLPTITYNLFMNKSRRSQGRNQLFQIMILMASMANLL